MSIITDDSAQARSPLRDSEFFIARLDHNHAVHFVPKAHKELTSWLSESIGARVLPTKVYP